MPLLCICSFWQSFKFEVVTDKLDFPTEKQLGWYMVETTEPAEEHPEDSAHLDFHMSDSPVHLDWQFV